MRTQSTAPIGARSLTDKASGYEPEDWGFESSRARQWRSGRVWLIALVLKTRGRLAPARGFESYLLRQMKRTIPMWLLFAFVVSLQITLGSGCWLHNHWTLIVENRNLYDLSVLHYVKLSAVAASLLFFSRIAIEAAAAIIVIMIYGHDAIEVC